jgi:SagB-type dehydrogenase family enzyme
VVHVTPGATFRNVPSAGARHALETYLLINNVRDVPGGMYRFLAIDHKLVEINTDPDIANRITEGCLGQDFIRKSAVTFIWAADAYRMKWRMGKEATVIFTWTLDMPARTVSPNQNENIDS